MNHQGVAKAKPQIRVLGILAKPDAQHIGSILMLALAIEGIRQHKPLPGLAEAFAHVLAQLRDVFIKGTIPCSRLFGRTGKRWIALPGITRKADEQRRSNEFPCRAGYPAEADDSGARQDRQRNGDDPAAHCPRTLSVLRWNRPRTNHSPADRNSGG